MDEYNGAAKPNFFTDFPSLGDQGQKPENKQADPEDAELAFVALTPGWQQIETFINDLEAELDGMITTLLANGASFEEIGQKTAVKEVTKMYLERVKEKVNDAKEAVEQQNG